MLGAMELGVATFADLSAGISPQERMRNLMEEVKLADELGLDVFAIGEHHREDFLISSPAVALAAAAVITERIRLSSAVTVLSSDDPVRVFLQFAEIDLLCAISNCPGGDLSVPGRGPDRGNPLPTCKPLGIEVYDVDGALLDGWRAPEPVRLSRSVYD